MATNTAITLLRLYSSQIESQAIGPSHNCSSFLKGCARRTLNMLILTLLKDIE